MRKATVEKQNAFSWIIRLSPRNEFSTSEVLIGQHDGRSDIVGVGMFPTVSPYTYLNRREFEICCLWIFRQQLPAFEDHFSSTE